jgi:uncharacterized RDD family membrane protein YckC
MISRTMAVAAAGTARSERARQALNARLHRLGALVLDVAYYLVLSLVVNGVYGVTQVTSGSLPVGNVGFFEYRTVTAVAWPWQMLLAMAYFTIPEALFGATPGKRLAGVCVVRVDGAPLSLQAMVIRNLLRGIDWLPFLYVFGGALTLFSTNSQRLGDLVAGTTVVFCRDATEPGATRNAGPRANRIAGIALVAAVLFTVAFDYFGRPPLIVQGMYNERHLLIDSGYSLGSAQWAFGRVTYPITGNEPGSGSPCSGSITFEWGWFGWQEDSQSIVCQP